MDKKVLLIIPAYNEADNILNTCSSIKQYSEQLDYIVINDASVDNTAEVCEQHNIKHISLVHNLGIGGAVQTGYKYAYANGYDIAIQFDGDGQHDINSINSLLQPIIAGNADFVIGSRFVGDESSFKSTIARRTGIKLISLIIKMLTGKRIYDTTSGFRACNRKLIEEFAKNYETEYPEPVSILFLLKKKYQIKEVPAKMHERLAGVSSIKAWKTIYYMINVVISLMIFSFRRYQ